MTPLTPEQVEIAARELCRLQGWDANSIKIAEWHIADALRLPSTQAIATALKEKP